MSGPATVALHHEQHGPPEAPALLLAGSLGTSLEMWRPQVEAFSGRFRVIALDHRGHGRSPLGPGAHTIADMGADVIALMDRLGLERAAYVGLSIGGMVGIWLGANAPRRLARMVLLCTSAHAPPPSRWLERAGAVRAAGTVQAVADAVLARWFTPGFAREHPQLVSTYREMLVATDPEGYARCCEAIAAMDLRDHLGRVTAPTLVVAALEDLALEPEHQRLVADGIPGARFEQVAHAAHIASAERPEQVNRLIEEHLCG